MRRLGVSGWIACTGAAIVSGIAHAQPDPSGIQFVTVGSPGNAPWTGGGLYTNHRGVVDYSYRIGKFEVTTSQWVEFMNAVFDRPASDRVLFVVHPAVWGAQSTTPNTPGGERWTASGTNAMLPVGGIDWRTCAIYCNWLCNGKSTDRSAFLSGAYDVSTFGYLNNGSLFTDQLTHSPGAQYWIPTTDEWLKAAHYDPNRYGTGQGGWWANANRSDTPPVYGPPGVLVNGQPSAANSDWDGFSFPGRNPFAVPLGAYNVTSAFGLYDTAGGTSEWTEGYTGFAGEPYPRDRLYDGSHWDDGAQGADMASSLGGNFPTYPGISLGLRIASAIPVPGPILGVAVASLWRLAARPRRLN
ncbi:MAG: SUMF1/EgtB/PvdO family nonheme iron enzyme [Phycisphaerales bacterium]|jgi:formylglycine-generating enzyme required for sulfatase activity